MKTDATRQNALLMFARHRRIDRTVRDDHFTSMPWHDLDALFSAMLDDVMDRAEELEKTDVFLYRDQAQVSDDALTKSHKHVRALELHGRTLAEQLHHGIENAFAAHYGRVVVLLENHPLITAEALKRAFDMLKYEDDCLVLGPTAEGKAYLLGLKSFHANLFDGSSADPAGTPDVLLRRLCQEHLIVFLAQPMPSLDTAAGLAGLKAELQAREAEQPEPGRHTARMFRALEQKYKGSRAAR